VLMPGVYPAHAFYFKQQARNRAPLRGEIAAYLKIPGNLGYTQGQFASRLPGRPTDRAPIMRRSNE